MKPRPLFVIPAGNLLLSLLLPVSLTSAQAQPDTLAKIHQTKTLTCGIDQSEAEYSTTNQHGPRVLFDQALCTAVAAAILGPSPHVLFRGYPDDETAARALRNKEIDLIPTLSTDFTHTTDPTLTQTRPILDDPIALLVATKENITDAHQLANKKICFLAETEAETALHDFFGSALLPFPFQEQGEMEAAYTTHNCLALAGDTTRLAAVRTGLAGTYTILPQHLAEDPLALTTRASDPALSRIAAAVLNALQSAAALGLTQHNLVPHTEAAAHLLGTQHDLGRPLGLPEDWPRTVLQTTGNLDEIYTRTLAFTPTPLPPAIPFK